MIWLQIYEFLLSYASHLSVIHQVIFNFFKILWEHRNFTGFQDFGGVVASNSNDVMFSIMNGLVVLHVVLLNVLHYYLIAVFFSKINEAAADSEKSSLKSIIIGVLQSIALVISTIDWFCMDWMTVGGVDGYGWFRAAGMFFLWAHSVPVVWMLHEKFRHSTCLSTNSLLDTFNVKEAWEKSYTVFTAVFLVSLFTGTLSWIIQAIKDEIAGHFGVGPLGILLLTYNGVLFYIIFPRMTNTYSRPFSLFSFVFMGVVMGLCDALMLAMGYRVASMIIGTNPFLCALGTLLLYLVPTAFYYAAIFNPKLAPEHRRPEWDLFKILSLTLSDVLVVVYAVYCKSWLVVCLSQSLVLAGIVSSMRYPSPWWQEASLTKK